MAAAAPDGNQGFDLFGTQAEKTSEHGTNAGPDLHRGAFASERDAAREGCGGAEEFSQHGAQQDLSIARVEGSFRLWYSAAAGVREISIEEVTDENRTNDWE